MSYQGELETTKGATMDVKRGRPKKDYEPDTLLNLNEAVEFVQKYFKRPVPVISKKTLYNHISAKTLKRYGPKHEAFVDKKEILEKFCRGKAS